jgi:hypothetical protein
MSLSKLETRLSTAGDQLSRRHLEVIPDSLSLSSVFSILASRGNGIQSMVLSYSGSDVSLSFRLYTEGFKIVEKGWTRNSKRQNHWLTTLIHPRRNRFFPTNSFLKVRVSVGQLLDGRHLVLNDLRIFQQRRVSAIPFSPDPISARDLCFEDTLLELLVGPADR